MNRVRNAVLRLLDPELGARVRAVLRAVSAVGGLAALAARADEVVAVITSLQGLLAVLVLIPTPTPPKEGDV